MFTNNYNEDYNDVLYFKSLYPESIMNIYRMVSDYSDKLEYNGSLMYDEYPDKASIRQIAIYINKSLNCPDVTEVPTECCPRIELIEVLLLNEFIHRRIRRRAFS